jgi:UPF0755 protein
MRLGLKILKSALLLVELFILAAWVWLYLESLPGAGRTPAKVTVEIEKGRRVQTIAQELKSLGVVRKKWPFLLGYELVYAPRTIKAGEYQLAKPGSLKDILEALVGGRIYLHPATVAEGLTGRETAAVFLAAGFGTEKGFLAAFAKTEDIKLWDPRARDLEGYLFPETYRLPKGASPEEIFGKMTNQFKAVFEDLWLGRPPDLRLTVRETVILASLVEKETPLPQEKPLVSAVFHNRLASGMKLDCDPTIFYALRLQGPFSGRLHAKDLKYDSPYNTYLYAGLPPGPICSPGKDSLEAALHPAASDYLYFVSKNDGGHVFSRTLREHLAAVNKYHR